MKTATAPTLVPLDKALGMARVLGLNLTTLQVLTLLAENEDDPLSLSAIAAQLDVCKSLITEAAKSLVRMDFAAREHARGDRRVVFLQITDKGQTAFQKLL